MYVIGTAGHVDHGKSTLVKALTGIDPDRLREEKEREMTIDLGFAWIDLPGGAQLGVIDVPGHRDFIENMLAGVGGIDAALFVVAADEGVMPQTREHLAILDLLGIPGGVIALTKTDMVDDPEWLELVQVELREIVQGTVLASAPIVPVSARTGDGLEQLKAALEDFLTGLPPRIDQGHPRLPIDRVFTISGFGTVVTGTLVGGSLGVGDAIELQPEEISGRVRGLQAYKTKLEHSQPGSRVAVNLSGVDKDQVRRGQVLTLPGLLRPTTLADGRFRHLADASRPLRHNAEVKFFSGAAESLAHIRLLDSEVLQPGEEGWVQVRLSSPLALARGDRFILRYPSPGETIGGGVVIDPAPGRRWRRHRPDVIGRLEMLARGTPAELAAQALERIGAPARIEAILKRCGMTASELHAALAEARQDGLAFEMEGGWWLAAQTYALILRQLQNELVVFHEAEPLRRGVPREQLRSRLGLERAPFERILERASDLLESDAELAWQRGYEVCLSARQQQAVSDLLRVFERSPYLPPSAKEAVAQVGDELFRYLVERGDLVLVAPDVVLAASVYHEFMRAVTQMLDAAGEVSARELRDRFDTSRKYAIAFLEHLDVQGITRRNGDVRVWGRRPAL